MNRTALLLLATVSSLWPQVGSWERRAPYPVNATEVSAAVLHGKIYATCGIYLERIAPLVYEYDPFADRWSAAASNPIGSADHCNLAAANGRLYLLGAIRIGSDFVDGNTYEFSNGAWRIVARMPTPRGASGVAVIGNKIYVAGGLAPRVSNKFEVFDTETREWSALPDMPTARDHLTAQAVNGRFYAIGGRAGANFALNEEFDPATNRWRARAPMPTARGGLASGALANRIQVFGGEGTSGRPERTFQENEEYDPATDTWRTLTRMAAPRHGFYGVTFEDRIFAISGGPREGATYSNTVDVFHLPPAEPPVANALVSAAGFGRALAPGSVASLFGLRLAAGSQAARGDVLRMNAVEVTVAGRRAGLYFTSPTQVNFVIPPETAPGAAAVEISHAGSIGRTSINVNEAAPDIFGIRLTPERGATIEVYLTGLNRRSVTATIGGIPAEILATAESAGFPGLDQVNLRIPAAAPLGLGVPLIVRAAGFDSPPFLIEVRPASLA